MKTGSALGNLVKAQRAEIVELERLNKKLLEENDKLKQEVSELKSDLDNIYRQQAYTYGDIL